MMGVYIKGMEMPTRCCECRLSTCHSFKERPLCDVLVEYMSYGEWEAKRLDNCPLIPVPPHGRLGDLDKLVEKIDGIWDCNDMVFKPDDHCCNVPEDCKGCKWAQTKDCIQRMVENAPTIIPAEEGE